ncbi:hypothetical protein P7K49_040292, partial [Saguinus oedipus]
MSVDSEPFTRCAVDATFQKGDPRWLREHPLPNQVVCVHMGAPGIHGSQLWDSAS